MAKKYFKVLSIVECPSTEMVTFHFNNERSNRHNNIVSVIGDGTAIISFLVDKKHPNGNEIHTIYSNGIIVVQNNRTKKIITELIARPKQITRYWENLSINFPIKYQYLLDLAKEHRDKKYNISW